MENFYNEQLEREIQNLQNQNLKLSSDLIGSNVTNDMNKNFGEFQIDTDELHMKLEKFFKGEYIIYDDEGNQKWVKPTNPELIPLNDFGVNSYMEIISKYVDKNTILSAYTEERIYEILGDLGNELRLFTYCNYEKMGLDTPFKKSKFRVLIISTLHIIESTYRRSINSKTLNQVNANTIVHQNDMMNNRIIQMGGKKKFSLLSPKTWI